MKKLIAISTEIGRGHPNYLDGVVEILTRKIGLPVKVYSVFEIGSGTSIRCWQLIKKFYELGSRGGMLTRIYNLIRSRPVQKGKLLEILGQDLTRTFGKFRGICLVEHPIVAAILQELSRVYYIHGEVAAPISSAIPWPAKIFVPLEYTKNRFLQFGIEPKRISVTGLMIEPGLIRKAKKSISERIERIRSQTDLTVGFFTSGAYPPVHIKIIIEAIRSLSSGNIKKVLFTGYNPAKLKMIIRRLKDRGLEVFYLLHRTGKFHPHKINIVYAIDRINDTKRTIELLPRIDVAVSAPHERINWSLGLGLPIFALMPAIGPFAMENYHFALKEDTVYPLDINNAHRFGTILENMRQDGSLVRMAQNGFGKYAIDGCQKAGEEILSDLES